jgi:L-ascorbate metabolism protein UlaG (beta-lactamase superfamily)
MNITWHGQTCFKIAVQKNKDGAVNILVDLYDKEIGLRPPKNDSDILISTSGFVPKESSSPFVINGPGEYDVKGVSMQGLSNKTNTIYIIEAEDIKICHLGVLHSSELSSDELKEIGDVDILMIPVGDSNALDAKGAIKLMSEIEPKITIPMYYKIPGLKEKLDGVDNFLKALGIKSLPTQPKLSIKKKDISSEEAKIVVLEP